MSSVHCITFAARMVERLRHPRFSLHVPIWRHLSQRVHRVKTVLQDVSDVAWTCTLLSTYHPPLRKQHDSRYLQIGLGCEDNAVFLLVTRCLTQII